MDSWLLIIFLNIFLLKNTGGLILPYLCLSVTQNYVSEQHLSKQLSAVSFKGKGSVILRRFLPSFFMFFLIKIKLP